MHITIKVMNVQLQDNGYACGELAVAFATSLIHGEDPTQLHYKELRSHFKNCVDTYSITPFPSTVVSDQPRVVHEIRKMVYCKCRAPDNGKLMIRCCNCRQGFHPECIGVGAQTDKWKCPTCTEALYVMCMLQLSFWFNVVGSCQYTQFSVISVHASSLINSIDLLTYLYVLWLSCTQHQFLT